LAPHTQAAAVVVAYEDLLARLAAEELRTNVALKLTHLGLELGRRSHAARFAEQHGIGRDRFEFHLLYGVRPQLQLELV
jgi:hypothetical protein